MKQAEKNGEDRSLGSTEARKEASIKEAQGIVQGNAKKAGEGLIQGQKEQEVAHDRKQSTRK